MLSVRGQLTLQENDKFRFQGSVVRDQNVGVKYAARFNLKLYNNFLDINNKREG